MVKRISFIVYFKSPKVLKRLSKLGEIHYYTKRLKYAVMYVDQSDKDSFLHQVNEIKLVKRVEESLFAGALATE